MRRQFLSALSLVLLVLGAGLGIGLGLSEARAHPPTAAPATTSTLSHNRRTTVPDVVGLSAGDPAAMLAAAGLSEPNSPGRPKETVASQSPTAGSVVTRGSDVTMTFVSGLGTDSATHQRSVRSCLSSQLAVSVTDGGGGAGHFVFVILARNKGPSVCRLSGYPAVDLFNAQGVEVGAGIDTIGFPGAPPSGAAVPSVALGKGEVASAQLEGRDVAGTCVVAHDYTITLPVTAAQVIHIHQAFESCSGLDVWPFIIGYNGMSPSGELVGRVPPCKQPAKGVGSLGVQIQAWSGSFLAGMVNVPSGSKAPQAFHMTLSPGTYTIRSPHDRTSKHVVVRAGWPSPLGTFGSCYQMTPPTIPGFGTTTTTTTPR